MGNTAEHGLVFTFTNADATDAMAEGVLSKVEPPVDEWFHLAATYDAATRTATLYLDGTQAGTTRLSFPPGMPRPHCGSARRWPGASTRSGSTSGR
ncbi:LamG-like jellyroll fold domain-containing protein [Nonomuraea sp. NPDC050691]|uniref:LamG-like jellyroll fold domain-containing protein n=1 Tax=Nonomuraea sp. NPDC050691 TaxID=3155661 RepID=UPI0033F4C1A8